MTPRKLFKADAGITLAGALLLGTLGGAAARDLTGGKTTMAKSLDFTQVRITDTFWRARQEQFLCVTVPAGIANVEKAGGGISNLFNAAKHNRGEACDAFEGALYVDSDVHKLVESMCYALQLNTDGNAQMQQAQEQIRAKLETWIGYYQSAQEADGYFDTYFTLAHPDEKFTDFNLHELYCAGHLYEAAVAHCRMTDGKDTRLLNVAIRNADYLCSLFGVGKWKAVPGHQEIELALLKLANLCRELGGTYAAKADAYTELASFFLRTRGDQEGRHGTSFWPEGCQDYAPITEQAQLLSHCVRAHYMCTAMADLELQTGTGVYTETLKRFWTSAQTKTYVTGAVGDQDHHEGYGPDYYMPISKSYGETCGSVSSIMWNQRMNLLFGESKYADEMELQLYNSMLSGVSLDGDRFFYHNLVSTAGRERVEWYGTACCPPNLMRTVLSLGGYVYTQQGDTVTMNLYVGNEADLLLSQGNAHLSVTSDFPWNGRVTIRLQADGARSMKLRLRIPDWAKGVNTLLLNGSTVSVAADAHGYAVLDRVWQNGDTLTLELPMQVQSVDMVEGCRDTEDYTAFRRGPIVYCAEAVDNAAPPAQYYLSPDAAFTEAWTDNLDGKADTYGTRGMMTLTTQEAHLSTLEESETVPLKLIPFYANSNRGSTAMEAYLSLVPKGQRLEFYAESSASHTFDGNEFDSVTHLNDNDESPESRWSSYNGSDVLPNPWVITDFVDVSGGTLKIQGDLLQYIGTAAASVNDASEPGLVLQIGSEFLQAATACERSASEHYLVSFVPQSGITFASNSANQIERSEAFYFTVTLDKDYDPATLHVYANGVPLEKVNGTYVIQNIYANQSVTAVCEKHEHTYGDYLHSSEAHWRECTSADCPDENRGRTEAEPHVYDGEHDAQCNVCGYERVLEPEKPEPEKPAPEKPEPEKPEPEKPEPEKPDTPPTGDRFPFWPMLLALSAMLLALLFPIRKKA